MRGSEIRNSVPTPSSLATSIHPPCAVTIAFVLASPFLAGIQNVIGLLIIGFALYEAWRVNAYTPFLVEGPFQLGARREETRA